MVELSYRIVDVFSDRPFAGNGLCVVDGQPVTASGPAGPLVRDATAMQAIARAMNLSETTFVRRTGDASYDVRIFTPAEELPFAGHPTVGAAWTLGPGTWTQRSSGATVTVEVTDRGATMSQPDPEFTEVYPEDAARAMRIPAHAAPRAFVADVAGTRHLIVPTDHPLEQLQFDIAQAKTATTAVRTTGLGAMRRVDDETVHLRLVAVGESVTFEDPGTGSAAGPVGLLARRLWGMGSTLLVRQGDEIGRPCRIHVEAVPGNVRVGGAVNGFARGVLSFD